MAIQLASDPKIKINGEELQGYQFLGFRMTKRLLEPNRFDFLFRKENMSLTHDDIKFELREKLLGALVECSVSAYRMNTEGEVGIDQVDTFFKGYIQHIKLERENNKAPMVIRCTAYSPDSRLKQYPGCSSRLNSTLADYVGEIVNGPSEGACKYNAQGGSYDGTKPLTAEIKPRNNAPMPYTVQYHESGYDFLKRLAKRYGEYFYYEDGTLYFGEMREYEPVTLRTGIDIEHYRYDLNMNEHLGIVLSEYDYNNCFNLNNGGFKKGKGQWKQTVESVHEMSQSAYEHAMEYFNDENNVISEARSARFYDENESIKITDSDGFSTAAFWSKDQHEILDKYVMADTLICSGEARRADLKLGSVMVLEDETNPEDNEATDQIQHEPLKVIDLVYVWNRQENRSMRNWFKAIPQKTTVPPYLERDNQGFLTYGDFDVYPHSGPQQGRVVDNKDPLAMGRVRVVMGWQFLQENINGDVEKEYDVVDNITPWIRVSQPYGGSSMGTYLVPEIGDEVVVAFEHNNAERPYVAGVMHNYAIDMVPEDWVKEESVNANEFKAIRTRNGHTIEIRDKKEKGYIKIYDQKTHHYVVTLDTDRSLIRLESTGNIELDAKKNIVIHAGEDISIGAERDIDVTALRNCTVQVTEDSKLFSNTIYRKSFETTTDISEGRYSNAANDLHFYSASKGNRDSGEHSAVEMDFYGVRMHSKDIGSSLNLSKEEGVSLNTNLGMKISASKDLSITSYQDMDVEATQQLNATGTLGLTLSTNGSAKLSSKQALDLNGGAVTSLTGSIVKIN